MKTQGSLSLVDESRNQDEAIHGVIASLLKRANDGIVMLAPGIAQRVLQAMNFDGQRNQKKYRIRTHAQRIASGLWNAGFPITLARWPNGRLVVVDGQHRLAAIAQHDASVPVRINVIDVDSEEQVRRVYIGFDESTSVRTTGEVLDGVGVGAELKILRQLRNQAFNALFLLRNDLEPKRGRANDDKTQHARDRDGRIAEFSTWHAEIVKCDYIVRASAQSHQKNMLNIGVLAVMMYTLRHQPAKAMDFWIGIARNDGLRKTDPRHTLLQDFHTRAMNSGAARQAVQAPVLAWNAFFEGRPLKIIKCIEGAPIRVSGTPLANRAGE